MKRMPSLNRNHIKVDPDVCRRGIIREAGPGAISLRMTAARILEAV